MKALFVHNSIFQFADNIAYSNNIPREIWNRYLKHFDMLKVIGREAAVYESGLNVAGEPSDRLSFTGFPNISFSDELLRYGRLVDLAKKHVRQADAVIVRLPSVIGIIFLEAARQLNKPAAAEIVGSVWHEYWYKGDAWSRMQAIRLFPRTRKVIRRLSHAIYVTESFLQHLYPCPGVTGQASNVSIRHINDNRQFTPQGDLVITTVGTLDLYYKGHDVVLKALSMLMRQGWDRFVFNCAGEGDSNRIAALAEKYGISNKVRILGSLTRDRLMALLDQTDLYIQPSRTEGLPRALIEAMSRGCPCLASTAGGIPELLPARYLHKPGDHAKLLDDILRCASDIAERQEMSRQNSKRAGNYLQLKLEYERNIFWSHFKASIKNNQVHKTETPTEPLSGH